MRCARPQGLWRPSLCAGAMLAACGLAPFTACKGGGGTFVLPDFHVYFALATADLDGHGHPVLAVTDSFHSQGASSQSVALLAGTPGGPPVLAGRLGVTGSLSDLAFGDLDGDGLADLVVLTTGYGQPNQLLIHLQDPAQPGRFRAPEVLTLPAGDDAVRIADLNGDGLPDLVTDTGQPVVLLQDPANRGHFLAPAALGVPRGWRVCGDFDGDGRTDLAVAAQDQTLRIFLQSASTGALVAGPVYTLPGETTGLCAGDLDGDGRLDLLVASMTARSPASGLLTAYVHDAGPAAAFHAVATGLTYSYGLGYRSLVCADLDGDGKADLAFSSGTSPGALTVCLQVPGAAVAFGPRADLPALGLPGATVVSDLDGDGRPDLVLADEAVLFYRQDPARPGAFLPAVRLVL